MYYQVTDYYDLIGQKKIAGKCPDCQQQDCLELFFYQKRTETPFSKKVSKKISGILYCQHTQTEISPVLWTDEIENYFNAEKGKQRLNPTGIKLTKWFYLSILAPALIIMAVIGYYRWKYQQHNEQSASIEQVQSGDKVAVLLNWVDENQGARYGNTWFLVTDIKGDTIFLRRHRNVNDGEGFDFDLKDSNFSGTTIKASLPRFKKRNIGGFDLTKMQFSGYITEIKK